MGTKYFNHDLCKACGGKCCTHYAGSYIPKDFKEPITTEFIVGLLNGGKVAIDWWEGDPKGRGRGATYFLRPRHVNEPAIKGSWGGVCVNWHKTKGCCLSVEDRPCQCRKLVPMPSYNDCYIPPHDKASKHDCVLAWYEYQRVLEMAIETFRS